MIVHLVKVCGVNDRLQVIGLPVFLLVLLMSGFEHAMDHVYLTGMWALLVTDMHKLTCHTGSLQCMDMASCFLTCVIVQY